jgi:co-chaperonin GroES (HSP10)
MTTFRPLQDYVLVALDPLPKTMGSLFLPDGASAAERVRTATVIRTGPGRWSRDGRRRLPLGVESGERVAFFRENLEHQQGKTTQHVLRDLGGDLGLIRSPDILYAWSESCVPSS